MTHLKIKQQLYFVLLKHSIFIGIKCNNKYYFDLSIVNSIKS